MFPLHVMIDWLGRALMTVMGGAICARIAGHPKAGWPVILLLGLGGIVCAIASTVAQHGFPARRPRRPAWIRDD
jgi:hypothetical protein